MSRSGDECIVALTDQWCARGSEQRGAGTQLQPHWTRAHWCRYIIYGEEEWRQAALACLEKMETFDMTGARAAA